MKFETKKKKTYNETKNCDMFNTIEINMRSDWLVQCLTITNRLNEF